jgi:hypothetical protein
MQHLLSSLYFTVVFLYMFREQFAPIIRSSKKLHVQPLVQVIECGSRCRDTVVVSRWYLAQLWPDMTCTSGCTCSFQNS